jgi:hypothetical protein
MRKPVLCLFRTGTEYTLSAMIAGCKSIEMNYYSDMGEAKDLIDSFFGR